MEPFYIKRIPFYKKHYMPIIVYSSIIIGALIYLLLYLLVQDYYNNKNQSKNEKQIINKEKINNDISNNEIISDTIEESHEIDKSNESYKITESNESYEIAKSNETHEIAESNKSCEIEKGNEFLGDSENDEDSNEISDDTKIDAHMSEQLSDEHSKSSQLEEDIKTEMDDLISEKIQKSDNSARLNNTIPDSEYQTQIAEPPLNKSLPTTKNSEEDDLIIKILYGDDLSEDTTTLSDDEDAQTYIDCIPNSQLKDYQVLSKKKIEIPQGKINFVPHINMIFSIPVFRNKIERVNPLCPAIEKLKKLLTLENNKYQSQTDIRITNLHYNFLLDNLFSVFSNNSQNLAAQCNFCIFFNFASIRKFRIFTCNSCGRVNTEFMQRCPTLAVGHKSSSEFCSGNLNLEKFLNAVVTNNPEKFSCSCARQENSKYEFYYEFRKYFIVDFGKNPVSLSRIASRNRDIVIQDKNYEVRALVTRDRDGEDTWVQKNGMWVWFTQDETRIVENDKLRKLLKKQVTLCLLRRRDE